MRSDLIVPRLFSIGQDSPRGKEEAKWIGSDLVSVPFICRPAEPLRNLFFEAATDTSIVIRSILILESLLCCCVGRAGRTSECMTTVNLYLLAVVRLLRPKKTRTSHVCIFCCSNVFFSLKMT